MYCLSPRVSAGSHFLIRVERLGCRQPAEAYPPLRVLIQCQPHFNCCNACFIYSPQSITITVAVRRHLIIAGAAGATGAAVSSVAMCLADSSYAHWHSCARLPFVIIMRCQHCSGSSAARFCTFSNWHRIGSIAPRLHALHHCYDFFKHTGPCSTACRSSCGLCSRRCAVTSGSGTL